MVRNADALIEDSWDKLRLRIGERFTTQHFQALVEAAVPKAWEELVDSYGPGGKGSGLFYSPANILANFLKAKARQGIVVRHGFVSSDAGWGSPKVLQWELVDSRALPALEEDIKFAEGHQKFRSHLVRERSSGLRKRLLNSRRVAGLKCDLCDARGDEFPTEIRDSIFEAHHDISPVSSGARETKLKDMALLCASCHRAIHRLAVARDRWFTVDQAAEEFERSRRG